MVPPFPKPAPSPTPCALTLLQPDLRISQLTHRVLEMPPTWAPYLLCPARPQAGAGSDALKPQSRPEALHWEARTEKPVALELVPVAPRVGSAAAGESLGLLF